MVNFAVLRLTTGGFDVVGFVATDAASGTIIPYIWRKRFEDSVSMLNAFDGFTDKRAVDMPNLEKFSRKELMPDHLAGAFSSVEISDAELEQAGFERYVRST